MFVCMCQWLCGCMDITVAGGVGGEVMQMLGLVNFQYSKTSKQRTYSGQASCPLWRGCPLLGGFLVDFQYCMCKFLM